MRLRKVNLSGFKSFVDPTVIDLPSDLVAIVGPNGCGKSNVIDAVRWVMGEISARHLRGDSMADVIFNGSTARKPVSQASVELVFDNSEGRLGERYASYTEISVRRQVTRDGSSTYFLNGTKCRRRDVTDLFLGTGLGPRSYAIIEQGMISRIIEARPDELREYLEEVAGISRYKERRRETENRMRHTREHLERLTDVREELDRQLQRLDRQARQAERYKVLKGEERETESQLLALRWGRLADETRERGQAVERASTAVQGAVADLRHVETEIETFRETHREATERANGAYRTVLEASANVARTEESIDNLKRQRTQLVDALEREKNALEEAEKHLHDDEVHHSQLTDQLREAEPSLENLEADSVGAQDRYAEAEQAMQQWQARWEELAAAAQGPAGDAYAERARIENLEERLQRLSERQHRVDAELEGVDLGAAQERLTDAQIAKDESGAAREQADATLEAARNEMGRCRQVAADAAESLHKARQHTQELNGAFASLTALQQEALGRTDQDVSQWLRERNLFDAPRLGEQVEVEDGWQHAVEVVLGARLEAVLCSDSQSLDDFAASLERHAVTLLSDGAQSREEPAADALRGKVKGPSAVQDFLAGARIAESVAHAQSQLSQLSVGEFFVTPHGVCVGQNWLQSPGQQDSRDGVIARAERLRALESEVEQAEAALAAADTADQRAKSSVKQAEDHVGAAQAQSSEAHRVYAATEARQATCERELEQVRTREAELQTERADLSARREVDIQELSASRARLGEATEALEHVESERAQWSANRETRRTELDGARGAWQRTRDEAYQLGLQVEGWRSRIRALEESRLRFTRERERLSGHSRELQEQVGMLGEPLEEASRHLQTALSDHQGAEAALSEERKSVEAIDAKLREMETTRQRNTDAVESARQRMSEAQLKANESAVRRDTVGEQLTEAGKAPEAALAALPEEADEPSWNAKLEDIARKISRLGAINLAAIDEHKELAERKTYLDAQHVDLEEALSTLEAAINRIDRETRNRFKETFEKVNRGIAERFPKLFGGGQAYLQLIGEDLLSAGVSVMAQPPGKRNSTIALLSGGEKALTAVALVFALFDLNPAPFCLLDEVDAPLDDANVGRFSAVVQEMSEQVQMLVVTHNKVTMEIGQQMVGVTMHEPGVSRLVAVDIDAAVAMVNA